MPVAQTAAQRDTQAPTACTVDPRTAGEIAALVATATPTPEPAAGGDAAGDRAGSLADLPHGEPADPQTVAEVTAAALEFAGCRNADDRPRRLALMTDRLAAEVVGLERTDGLDGAATPVPEEIPSPTITAVRVRDARVLPDGRVDAIVVWRVDGGEGGYLNREANVHVFERVGDRWLLDQEIGGNVEERDGAVDPEGDAAPQPESDDEILGRAPAGFNEVDSAAYAEPTLMGAQFTVAATLMVGFENDDDYEGVGCEFFTIERGEHSVTASAFCRADEALVGRAAYLMVEAYGPRRASDTGPSSCRDVTPLADYVTFACTVELPASAPYIGSSPGVRDSGAH